MATDAIAKKFTDGFNRIGFSDKSVKDLLEKLNKQIFHLTKKRTTVESGKFNVGKDGMEALQIIEPAIESFTRCLSPNFQPHFKCTTTPLLVRNLLPFASTTATFAGTAKQARV